MNKFIRLMNVFLLKIHTINFSYSVDVSVSDRDRNVNRVGIIDCVLNKKMKLRHYYCCAACDDPGWAELNFENVDSGTSLLAAGGRQSSGSAPPVTNTSSSSATVSLMHRQSSRSTLPYSVTYFSAFGLSLTGIFCQRLLFLRHRNGCQSRF